MRHLVTRREGKGAGWGKGGSLFHTFLLFSHFFYFFLAGSQLNATSRNSPSSRPPYDVQLLIICFLLLPLGLRLSIIFKWNTEPFSWHPSPPQEYFPLFFWTPIDPLPWGLSPPLPCGSAGRWVGGPRKKTFWLILERESANFPWRY